MSAKGYKIARLSVQKSDWEAHKELEKVEVENKMSKDKMFELKERVVAAIKLSSKPANKLLNSRKRIMSDQVQDAVEKVVSDNAPAKRQKVSGMSTKNGACVWDKQASKFVRQQATPVQGRAKLNPKATSTPAQPDHNLPPAARVEISPS